MKLIAGTNWMLPDGEEHLLTLGRKSQRPVWQDYQHNRIDRTLRYLPPSRRMFALDIGAHVGLITNYLATNFREVWAFEPSPESYACLQHNTSQLRNVTAFNNALGSYKGPVSVDTSLVVGENTGNRQVHSLQEDSSSHDTVEQLRLDDLYYPAPIDLIKIDVQGYEYEVLQGARNTLAAFSPILIVELEPPGKLRTQYRDVRETRALLKEWGAILLGTIGADHIYGWGPDGAVPYTKYARRGDYHWQSYQTGKHKRQCDTVVEIIRQQEGPATPILDVGCGDGLYTHLLGANTYGIDNNYTAIQLAKQHGVQCEHLSVYYLAQLQRKFEVACMFDTFEHMAQQDLVLRTLVDNNIQRLYILNPEPNQSGWHTREFTADELVNYMKSRGWEEFIPRVSYFTETARTKGVLPEKVFLGFRRVK